MKTPIIANFICKKGLKSPCFIVNFILTIQKKVRKEHIQMSSILEIITEWIKELLIGAIESNLRDMFGDVNTRVGEIAAQVPVL